MGTAPQGIRFPKPLAPHLNFVPAGRGRVLGELTGPEIVELGQKLKVAGVSHELGRLGNAEKVAAHLGAVADEAGRRAVAELIKTV
ncbi:hypothetical protein [Hyphomicrobium sp. D-2]|uniref:hypothetical protein n=1 Tax=Hyphomicrobium sp. D-2 TaxID=3041621 RepID=UPI002457966C|nr:hypothetical protein [Hyphomicrobium sp. D-2]MDH4981460.1 hypothetical protein [Hyphomicrobium sp. D-2]